MVLIATMLSANAQNKAIKISNPVGTNDASSQYVEIPALNLTSLPVTIECWVNSSADPTDEVGVFGTRSYEDRPRTRAGLFLYPASNSGSSKANYNWNGGDGGCFEFDFGLEFENNTWHHLALVVESDKATMYLDGVAGNVNNYDHQVQEFELPAWTGRNETGGAAGAGYTQARMFNGMIDELRIWSSARTDVEINANKDAELNPANEPDLVAYYTCNELSQDGKLIDLKNGNNGTLVNLGASDLIVEDNGISTDVEDLKTTAEKLIIQKGNSLVVPVKSANAVICLYDLNGRCVYKQLLMAGENTIELSQLNGLYIVKLTQDSQVFTKKVILRK